MTRTLFLAAVALAALSAAAGLVLFSILEPLAMLQGWLTAFVWATMIPVGALTLLVIHRLTGGDWGFALAPVLEPAARAILPVAVIAIPVLIFSGDIYRWSSPDMSRAVADSYMTPGLYAVRAIFALAFWSVFAWFESLRATPVGAAVCLFGLAIITNMVPVDWVVSAQPGFYSTAFGFGFGIDRQCLRGEYFSLFHSVFLSLIPEYPPTGESGVFSACTDVRSRLIILFREPSLPGGLSP